MSLLIFSQVSMTCMGIYVSDPSGRIDVTAWQSVPRQYSPCAVFRGVMSTGLSLASACLEAA